VRRAHRGGHPADRLVEQRGGRPEVEPREAAALPPEAEAGLERDAPARQERRRRIVAQVERAAVQPGEEARVRRAVTDGREALVEQLADPRAVGVERGQQLVQPGVAVRERGLRAGCLASLVTGWRLRR
jgi:hypothetical protein